MTGGGGFVNEVREIVDARLRAYFTEKKTEGSRISPMADELICALEALTMRGGKRLRPVVLGAAYRAVAGAGSDLSKIADASAGLELLQSYLLIHDDWMDGDDERRGGPSVHRAFRSQGKTPHLSDSLAVLSGDLGSTYAWELALATPWPARRRGDALAAYVELQVEVLFGQQLDLSAHPDVSLMHQLKTGSYTVRGPLRLGGLLGDGTDEQLAALGTLGTPLGEAFQLRDDLIGTFGETAHTGKPKGNDLRAGKQNSLVAEAKRSLSAAELGPLEAVLGKTEATEALVTEATELLVSSGARSRVEARLSTLLGEAREAIDNAPFDEEGRRLLGDVADRLAVRSY